MADNSTYKDASGATVTLATKDTGAGVNIEQSMAGVSVRPSANFNRPANTTPYSLGALIANNTAAASVTPLTFANVVRVPGGGGMVRRAKLRKSSNGIANALFRLHLFDAAPTVATTGDGGVFSTVVSGAANELGQIDFTFDSALADGATCIGVPRIGGEIILDLPSTGTTIYGLLEARAGYVPTSAETFTVDLEILQD